jgi:hypothetical protein
MLTVCCVQAGDYANRGPQYVEALRQGVVRGLGVDRPHRFVCFTDDERIDHYRWEIMLKPLPHPGLKGWMNKLSLFKAGVFEPGERVLYIDLDTVIAGSIDGIASYAGQFAMLEDLVYPEQMGSGVMAWEGGFGAHIWDTYAAVAFPDVKGGDQVWISHCVPRAQRLQDLYPGQIASFKLADGVLAPQSRIVCFHGRPRPHEVETGWVPKLWRV